MQRGIAVLTFLLMIPLAGCASHSRARAERRVAENTTRDVAERWVEMLDDGDYEEAFEHESIRFRIAGTQKQFVRYMQGRRAPFGHVESRAFIGAVAMRKMVGLPDGTYASVLFKSTFENKSVAAERVIVTKEAGRWKVIDYRIY
jgi:uncharacterized protein DUF4019